MLVAGAGISNRRGGSATGLDRRALGRRTQVVRQAANPRPIYAKAAIAGTDGELPWGCCAS